MLKNILAKPVLLVDGRVPLDPLYEKMIKKINSKEMNIIPNSALLSAINKSELQSKD